MFSGTWCGNMGLTGWLVMATFWVAFLALVVWAVTRFVSPGRVLSHEADRAVPDPRETLDRRLATGELDPDSYQRLRDELAAPGPR